jgi:hypothetical protein
MDKETKKQKLLEELKELDDPEAEFYIGDKKVEGVEREKVIANLRELLQKELELLESK